MSAHIERHDAIHREISEKDAKQGVALGHVRYVLGVSLLLATIAGVSLYLTFFY